MKIVNMYKHWMENKGKYKFHVKRDEINVEVEILLLKKNLRGSFQIASGCSLNELIVSAVRGDFRRATQTRPAVERLIKLFHY